MCVCVKTETESAYFQSSSSPCLPFLFSRMCGTKLPTQPVRDILISSGNYLTMTFHTGSSKRLKGFKVYAVGK